MKQTKLTNEQIALELLSGKVWCPWCYKTGKFIFSDGTVASCGCCEGAIFISAEHARGWQRGKLHKDAITLYREHGYEPQDT